MSTGSSSNSTTPAASVSAAPVAPGTPTVSGVHPLNTLKSDVASVLASVRRTLANGAAAIEPETQAFLRATEATLSTLVSKVESTLGGTVLSEAQKQEQRIATAVLNHLPDLTAAVAKFMETEGTAIAAGAVAKVVATEAAVVAV